jgi:hypothetical protein
MPKRMRRSMIGMSFTAIVKANVRLRSVSSVRLTLHVPGADVLDIRAGAGEIGEERRGAVRSGRIGVTRGTSLLRSIRAAGVLRTRVVRAILAVVFAESEESVQMASRLPVGVNA